MTRTLRLTFVVESGTDVRLAEELGRRYDLRILARTIPGGVEISRPPRVPVEMERGPSSRMRFAAFVRRRLLEGAPDFVLVQGYGLAALAASRAAARRRVPVALLVCSPVEAYYRARRIASDARKPFRLRELVALQGVARMNAFSRPQYVVLSEHLASVVRAHGGSRIAVIPLYGVDLAIFHPLNESKEAAKRRGGLPATGKVIFFSSRVAPEKDAETLMRAFAMLRSAGEDLWLLHRSGGFRAVEDLARAHGVADRIVATDAVAPFEGLADDYRASDLCVQASREEGLGFSVLESLACGTPVVAAAVGGLRETIRDGETGWTYPVGDAETLAEAIREALGDPAEAARRTAAGRAMVVERYERDRVFDRFHELIQSMRGAAS